MNIRGTDATALAATNDLFAVTAPVLDKPAIDFSRTLQGTARSEESNSSRSSSRHEPTDVSSTRGNTDAAEQSKFEQESHKQADDSSTEARSESSSPDNTDEQDIAAESLVVASTQSAAPTSPVSDKEVVAVEEVKVGVAGEQPEPLVLQDQPIDLTGKSVPIAASSASEEAAADAQPPATAEEAVALEATPGEAQASLDLGKKTKPRAPIPPPAQTSPVDGDASLTIPAQGYDESRPRNTNGPSSAATGTLIPPEKPSEDPAATIRFDGNNAIKPADSFGPHPLTMPGEAPGSATPTEPLSSLSPASLTTVDGLSTRHVDSGNSTIAHPNAIGGGSLLPRLPAHALVQQAATQVMGQSAGPASVPVNASRFLQRVVGAFESARDRGGEIRLRLSPPELGVLRVEVTLHELGLVARVSAETPDARAILLENLPALRERLTEQGLRLERFEVDLLQQEPNQQGRNLPDQSQQRHQPIDGRPARPSNTRPPTPEPPRSLSPTPITDWQNRRLNVIV